MRYTIICLLALMLGCPTAHAQEDDSAHEKALLEIIGNNKEIEARHELLKAQALTHRAGLSLPDPELEVAYLLGSPRGVPGRTNVSLMQTLDWGVLTGRRRQLAHYEGVQDVENYYKELYRILAEADRCLVSLVYYNKVCLMLARRCHTADETARLYTEKYDRGDVSRIDLNKVRLNASVAAAALGRAEAERTRLRATLRTLNGGRDLAFDDTLYARSLSQMPPLVELQQQAAGATAMQAAESEIKIAEARRRLARAEAMPALTVGFQGEYIKANNYSGAAIGLTLPLWGNSRRRVRQAEAQTAVSRLALEELRTRQANLVDRQYAQALALGHNAATLRRDLEQACNLPLLQRSLEEGEISVVDYLMELSFYYEAESAVLEAERDEQLAISQLYFLTR